MSLAQHVTHAEGFDYEPPVAEDMGRSQQQFAGSGLPVDNKSGWRRMSFSPTEPPISLETPRHAAAYKVSAARRLGM
jgi:hypothetical protein